MHIRLILVRPRTRDCRCCLMRGFDAESMIDVRPLLVNTRVARSLLKAASRTVWQADPRRSSTRSEGRRVVCLISTSRVIEYVWELSGSLQSTSMSVRNVRAGCVRIMATYCCAQVMDCASVRVINFKHHACDSGQLLSEKLIT